MKKQGTWPCCGCAQARVANNTNIKVTDKTKSVLKLLMFLPMLDYDMKVRILMVMVLNL
jgi:hypothetical protein